MRELNVEQRLDRIDDNLAAIRRMLEGLTSIHKTTKPVEENEIMSVKQLAQFLGLDATIIYAKCAKGEIPYFKLGKQYRFKKIDIEKWLKEQQEPSNINVDDYVNRYLQQHTLKT